MDMTDNSMRVVVLGAVESTNRILQALVRNGLSVVGVAGLDESVLKNVSGFATPRMRNFCEENGIPFATFINVNDPDSQQQLQAWKPDVLFAVGFSQLVGDTIMKIPRLGVVGFHPTRVPRGRGRAPGLGRAPGGR